jgi:uncharacterized protein YjlB
MQGKLKRNNMEIIQKMIAKQGYFPGNPYYPLLIYKKALADMNESPRAIQLRLEKNNWCDSWIDSIYDFHHYHYVCGVIKISSSQNPINKSQYSLCG